MSVFVQLDPAWKNFPGVWRIEGDATSLRSLAALLIKAADEGVATGTIDTPDEATIVDLRFVRLPE